MAEFGAIPGLADRGCLRAERLGWLNARGNRPDLIRRRSVTWMDGTAAAMGCKVRRLRLPRRHGRGFRKVQRWGDGCQRARPVLARPVGLAASEPRYPVSNLDPTLDLVWLHSQRFRCEPLFREHRSGLLQLERSGLRSADRIDRLLLLLAGHAGLDSP